MSEQTKSSMIKGLVTAINPSKPVPYRTSERMAILSVAQNQHHCSFTSIPEPFDFPLRSIRIGWRTLSVDPTTIAKLAPHVWRIAHRSFTFEPLCSLPVVGRYLSIGLHAFLPAEWFLPSVLVIKLVDEKEELSNEIRIYQALRSLQGKCVPRFYGAISEANSKGDCKGFAMDFIEAEQLWTATGRPVADCRLSPNEINQLVRRCMEAADELTKHRVSHDDLNPGNLRVSRREEGDWSVTLIDFGFSHLVGDELPDRTSPDTEWDVQEDNRSFMACLLYDTGLASRHLEWLGRRY